MASVITGTAIKSETELMETLPLNMDPGSDGTSQGCMMCYEIGITKMQFSNDISSMKQHIEIHMKQTNQCFARCMKLCFPSYPLLSSAALSGTEESVEPEIKDPDRTEDVTEPIEKPACSCDDCQNRLKRGGRRVFTYNCESCNYTSTIRGNIIRHAKTHQPDTSQQAQWACGHCSMVYRSRDRLRRHTIRNHSAVGPNSLRHEVCEFCKATFEWAYQLRYHRRSLHGIKEGPEPLIYFCDVCDLKAKSKQVITLHIVKRCNYELYKSYLIQCEKCSFNTPFKQKLAEHCEIIHERKVRFICTICSKEFVRLKSLKLHEKSHETMYMTKDFPCPHCTKAFTRNELLKAHIKNIHVDANIMCENCNHNFPTRLFFRWHLKSCFGDAFA